MRTLLALASFGSWPRPPRRRPAVDTTPTIAADGIGTATLTPDIADFTAGVARIAPTSAARATRPTAAMAAVCRAPLKAGGVAAADIRTVGLSVARERVSQGQEADPLPRASRDPAIRVRDVAKLGALLDARRLGGRGRGRGEPEFGFADPSAGRLLATRAALGRRAGAPTTRPPCWGCGSRACARQPRSRRTELRGRAQPRSGGGGSERPPRSTRVEPGHSSSPSGCASSTPRRRSPSGRTGARWTRGGRPSSGRSYPPRGRLRRRPPETSEVEPPPSRFSAV